jgi:ABC-2 type transport system permease protein
MLAYKAWHETRTRFLLSTAALAWFCALFIVADAFMANAASQTFSDFDDRAIFTGPLRSLYVIFVAVFGLGGLRDEASRGSVHFTLSLPVTRTRLVATRALVGLGEVAALAFVPVLVVLVSGLFLSERYSAANAVAIGLRWMAAGGLFFAISLMFSISLQSGSGALTATLVAIGAYGLAVNLPFPPLASWANAFELMSLGHAPGSSFFGIGVAAAVFVLAAVRITGVQDF